MNLGIEIGASIGRAWFAGIPDPSVHGTALYVGVGGGADPVLVLEPAGSVAKYTIDSRVTSYITDGKVEVELLLNDIQQGVDSPWKFNGPAYIGWISEEVNFKYWFSTWAAIHKYRDVYEDVHQP
jgi:hypothetical protein